MIISEAVGLNEKEKVIAVMGAGGKTTFIFQLGRELKHRGNHVLLTTTTQMFAPGEDEVDSIIIVSRLQKDKSFWGKTRKIQPGTRDDKLVFMASRYLNEKKVKGISQDLVGKINAGDMFHKILVEADGSRRKPMKSYDFYEPVLPNCSDLVVIMAGLSALGKPVTEEYIHRASLAAQYLKSPQGTALGIEHFARLIEQGAEKARTQAVNARIIAFINQVDDRNQEQKALPLVSRLLGNGLFDRIVIGSCQNPELSLKVFR